MDTSDFLGPETLTLIMVGLALAMFANNPDPTVIAIAISYITDEFHTIQDVGWYVSSTFLAFASFQSTWGEAYGYYPLKIPFLFSLFVSEIDSLRCALGPTSTSFIVVPFAALGLLAFPPESLSSLPSRLPPERVLMYMGVAGETYAIASLVGPILGGMTAVSTLLFYHMLKVATLQPATWKEKFLQAGLNSTSLGT